MNLKKAVIECRSKAQSNRIVEYVGNDKDRFAALVRLFLDGPYRTTQRASWPLTCCIQNDPKLVKPWLREILSQLKKDEVHPAIKRNTIRSLQFVELPGKYWGPVTDLCLKYLIDKKEPVAIRVFSMTVLYNLSKNVPEIKRELRLVIEDQLPFGSPAFTSRAKKVLSALDLEQDPVAVSLKR